MTTFRPRLTRLVALVALASATALAQPRPGEAEFKRGRELLAQGKYAEACAAFDKSQALEPSVAVMLNQASCREKNGQLATALALFTTAAKQTDGLTDAKNQKFHKAAVDHAAQLSGRVSTLVIEVAPANRVIGLVIKRGNDVVDPNAWNNPLPIDGGTYVIEASAPDYKSFTTSVTVGVERDKKTITIPLLEVVAKPDTTKPDDTKLEKPDTTKPDTTKPDDTKLEKPDTTRPEPVLVAPPRSRLPAWIVGGAGAVLVGVSIALEISAGSTYDAAKSEGNDDAQDRMWQDANHQRYAAEMCGIAGIAAVGIGVFLFLRSGDQQPRVQPAVGSDHASVIVTGRF